MDSQELFDALCAPFPTEMIDWRVGSTNKEKTKGMALGYVDARTVMDRLDSVCGIDGWQCNYSAGVNGSIVCNIGVRMSEALLSSSSVGLSDVTTLHVPSQWVWKADGAGATDFEGEKGALSDAFKRAAVRFGIGRYLYDMAAPWIEIEELGKSYRIKETEKSKLSEMHEKIASKLGWGERSGIQAYRLLRKNVLAYVTDTASAQDFQKKNAPEIALLPVAMRKHLIETLDRIGARQEEAA